MAVNTPKEKHDHKTLEFPKGFLWGSSTSAYQVEGGNIYSDWETFKSSGKACDQYNLFKEDFALAKALNQNAHRLSIEWSRIEPEEGKFDQKEIEHYKNVLKDLKEKGFTVMLTLWHFTLPLWVAEKGGFENGQTVEYFLRFLEKIYPELKQYVDLWITINEPGLYVFMAYLGGDETGSWPPQKKDKWTSFKVIWHLSELHKKVYSYIKSKDANAQIGIAQNIQSFSAYHKHSLKEEFLVMASDILSNHSFYFMTKGHHDFLGINYYFHHRFNSESEEISITVDATKQTREVSDLGWEVYPQGIYEVLTDLKDHVPIYITECGIATSNDDRRMRFLLQYLQEVYRAIKGGVDVRGFFYWSLIDNYEWHRGFEPRFGLVEIDYQTQKRTPRPSAYLYGEIAKNNGIPHYLMRFLGHTVKAEEVLCGKHDSPKLFCEHIKNSE